MLNSVSLWRPISPRVYYGPEGWGWHQYSDLLEVVNECGQIGGDHLLCSHGGMIDGACINLMVWLQPSLPKESKYKLGYHGGMFGKCEGFVAIYEDYNLKSIELIRQPTTLRAMNMMLAFV